MFNLDVELVGRDIHDSELKGARLKGFYLAVGQSGGELDIN